MRIFPLIFVLLTTACASGLRPVPEAWRTVPEAARITDLCARVTCATKAKTDVRVEGGRVVAGGKALTPAFAAIQSFDVSLDRREVVFSARQSDNFDIGFVSLDGSEVHWAPAERFDETDVQWAPRGNKVSYTVHTSRGDLVRTLHVPSSTQLSVDFADAQVDALAWDPAAERYAVVVESPDASQRVESTKYGGEGHRVDVQPASKLDVVVDTLAGALILRPSAIRYNERLPVVVWVDPQPFRWSDARAALLRNARVAVAIVKQPPDAAFWNELRKTKWLDEARVIGVNLRTQDSGLRTSIIEDPSIPEGFYREEPGAVRTGKVQSFAAGYIAHELNTNGFR